MMRREGKLRSLEEASEALDVGAVGRMMPPGKEVGGLMSRSSQAPQSASSPDMTSHMRLRRENGVTQTRRANTLEDLLTEEESASSSAAAVECAGGSQWPASVFDVFHVAELPSGGASFPNRPLRSQLAAAAAARQSEGKHFFLYSGASGAPHPAKASSGGADSHFAHCRALGIADGVGEWEWKFGLNPRDFADELMAGCGEGVRQLRSSGASGLARECARHALRTGYDVATSFGSSTALVAALGQTPGRPGELGVANIGDSSLVQLRRREAIGGVDRQQQPPSAQSAPPAAAAYSAARPSEPQGGPAAGGGAAEAGPFCCMARTREQQHAFNCPYQLARLPQPADYPELLRQGKDKLVRTVQRCAASAKLDTPDDAEVYTFCVQEGDLLVLGTDGVFDNLYIHEVIQIASQASSPVASSGKRGMPTEPARIATAITRAAFHRSVDRDARTPFGDNARKAGMYHRGGKMDDITCVCAWVMDVEATSLLLRS